MKILLICAVLLVCLCCIGAGKFADASKLESYCDIENKSGVNELKFFSPNLDTPIPENKLKPVLHRIASNKAWTRKEKMVISINNEGKIQQSKVFPETADWDRLISVLYFSQDIVALREDGTLVYNSSVPDSIKEEISGWKNIVSISCSNSGFGIDCIFGIRSDGKVLSCGFAPEFVGELSKWNNICSIVGDSNAAFGLKTDGTVLAAGKYNDDYLWSEVISDWKDMKYICYEYTNLYGVTRDGKFKAAGIGRVGIGTAYSWEDLVSVEGGNYCLVGLKSDGTVVSTGNISGYYPTAGPVSYYGQDRTDSFCNVKELSAGHLCVAALDSNGNMSTNYSENAVEKLITIDFPFIYSEFIKNKPEYREDDDVFTAYIYDIDGNGLPELIVRSGGSPLESNYDFYEINSSAYSANKKPDEYVKKLGSCYSGRSELASAGVQGGLLISESDSGSFGLRLGRLENGKLSFTRLREFKPLPKNSPFNYPSGEPAPIPFYHLKSMSYTELIEDPLFSWLTGKTYKKEDNDILLKNNARLFGIKLR